MRILLKLLLFVALLSACAAKKTIIPTPNQDVSGATGGSSTAGVDTGSTSGGTNDTGPVAEEDAPPPVTACDPATAGDLRVGMPCSDHQECQTCYCYDEAYLAPFRFCTKDCSSGVGSSCSDESNDLEEFKCLKFTVAQMKDHELKVGGLCMPQCQSVDECQIYSSKYGHCPTSSTQWEGSTVQAAKTCQTTPQ